MWTRTQIICLCQRFNLDVSKNTKKRDERKRDDKNTCSFGWNFNWTKWSGKNIFNAAMYRASVLQYLIGLSYIIGWAALFQMVN